MTNKTNRFAALLDVQGKKYRYYPVSTVAGSETLPYALTVLLENVLRNAESDDAAEELAARVVAAGRAGEVGSEIEFSPARVLFQDFTGVPVFVDFAVMREACAKLGGDPTKINPQIPCDLVIDHSVIADEAGCAGALARNMELEFSRNRERYEFLKWAQQSFDNVRIVPPGAGICHQLNIEQFAHVAMTSDAAGIERAEGEPPVAYFDTLVGTDSHTPTANGIGVLGWGVGGIEAEAAALGQPITTLVPRVVGVRLVGALADGVCAMDVALTFAQTLRAKGVVGSFVECFGPGLANLSATQRACIANMTPEYGSTCTLFPVDEQTLAYLRLTGRTAEQVALAEVYAKAQGFWNDPEALERTYAEVIELDLGSVERSLAGPSRPHDRIPLSGVRDRFLAVCAERGLDRGKRMPVEVGGEAREIGHGAIAIAAVTSCTTATDPRMMLACGLVAQKASEAGLSPKPWVKTILAPGSKATELLLERAGLMEGLRSLGFHTCGFGCMSCIGNSGPVVDALHDVADEIELASVLSGNRNFEGRISPDVSQNYLAAPALVITYALAGTMDVDLLHDALGTRADGTPVHLADIWPTDAEIDALMASCVNESLYADGARGLYDGDAAWQELGSEPTDTFAWDEASTYVRRAPYFDGMTREPSAPAPVKGAYALARLGDFITTDHISPAGSIAPDSPAARYLEERGVASADFNTYGARRGNHEVMMRGTFANVKLQNVLADGKKGGWTRDFLAGEVRPLFDAAMGYEAAGVPLVVVAGKMYGSGSSRDWAAKGPALLGVRAAFAESFERIHRSNLIGMGILPLQFQEGESAEALGLDGTERYTVAPIDFSAGLPEPRVVGVTAERADGTTVAFEATVRVDTPTEGRYYANGGILPFVLRQLL
ncbi:Aconitate hydratase [Coriobacteriaceae bacterium CHKCI002]|uniref:Aconitate hydratase n=1 Tax=Rubneribacter badeniensis TaxID=2070688 RepID=A0A9D3ADB8_9ACTN|nr:aconitate hydratase 1 [Gordonibacter sp. An232A]CVH75955.1 Aconitate hydratase [Coriobacteriaceae bacterium CHKCI002]HJH43699.1 aconitate hydratase AcnA [Rubneribacter badeniensis]